MGNIMRTTLLPLTTLLIALLVLASCKSPNRSNGVDGNGNNNATTIESINVPSNFDWKTFADYEFTVNAGVPGLVEVLSKRGGVYHRAYLNGREAYTFVLSLPTYEKEVRLRHQGQETVLDLSSKSLFHSFETKPASNNKNEIISLN